MNTTFQVEVENKLIRLTYGKLLGTIVIESEHVAISLNGTRAIRGHSQDRIERKVVKIVMDFMEQIGSNWSEEKPIHVYFKNLERRKLYFYHFHFTPDGEIHANKLPEADFIELVMPEQTRDGERHHGWYLKPDEKEDAMIWCYDPIDHLLVRATPTEQGVALRVISETNDPRINSQEAFTTGKKPPVERLHEALRAYLKKYDLGELPEPGAESPEMAIEAIRMALRMATEAPVQRRVFNITGQGEIELDVALVCGFKMMKQESGPTESCEIYYGEQHFWLYTETKIKGETFTTWEKKSIDEIVDFFQTRIMGQKAKELIAPNMLN